jgi:hypothetical protein
MNDRSKNGTLVDATTARFERLLTAAIKSDVSFELEARGLLTHRRVDLKYASQVLAGWHPLLDVLEMRLRSTPAFRFMDRFEANHPQYPAKT